MHASADLDPELARAGPSNVAEKPSQIWVTNRSSVAEQW
jgi:hypothetical protein